MSLIALYWEFFWIGLITIGGGQVGITIMYDYIVDGGLLTAETFYNMVAISESTPGPVGINMATYIGCKSYGIWGGIVCTLGTVTPSIIIIICIAKFFSKFSDSPLVQNIFICIRPVVTGLILVAVWQVFRISVLKVGGNTIFNIPCLICFLCMFALMLKTKIPPIIYIVAGAVFGIVVL
jgi:chromate transporter